MQGSGVGDSISVSGVCLTMLDPDAKGFSADVSVETLDKTSLGARGPGDSVNLELAMRASDRFGGASSTYSKGANAAWRWRSSQ